MMSFQDYFNGLLGLVAFLGSWWMKSVWVAIKQLEKTDSEVFAKVTKIEILIAGEYAKKQDMDTKFDKVSEKISKVENIEVEMARNYVSKTDLTNLMDTLLKKLDRIEEKIDNKADKN